jgi:RND superfamily putative drug exporter
LPALLGVLGHRANKLRLPMLRRHVGVSDHGAWYRLAQSVMRRPVRYVVVLVPLMLVLGIPFLQAQLGGVDHRALPAGASSREVTETLQRDFAGAGGSDVLVAVRFSTPPDLDGYVRSLGDVGRGRRETAALVDLLDVLAERAPWMAGFIVLITFVLLFVAFGSLVLPAKALLMNVLSLSASFGAMVWIFQDGNLADLLDFTPAGSSPAPRCC